MESNITGLEIKNYHECAKNPGNGLKTGKAIVPFAPKPYGY